MSSSSIADYDALMQELHEADPPSRDEGGKVGGNGGNVDDQNTYSPGMSSFSQVDLAPSSPRGESNKMSTSLRLPSAIIAASSISKRYKLWICPDEGHDLCFRIIGQGGSTFCILSNCSTNHKSGKHFEPRPGYIYVMKTTSTVFVSPSISSKVINVELLSKWLEDACSIDEWHKRFLLLKQEIENPILRLASEKISQLDLEAKDTFVSSALVFKTPKKKFVSLFTESSKDFTELERLTTKIDPEDNLIITLDNKFQNLVYVLETLHSNQNNDSINITKGFESTDLKLSQFQDKIGSPPEFLDTKFSAPNLWLSLGLIADERSRIPVHASISEARVLELISKRFDNGNIDKLINDVVFPVNKQVQALNDFVVNAVRLLNKKVSTSSPHIESSHHTNNSDFPEREQRMWDKINELESELISYRSTKDEAAIKFGQLGIRNPKEMDSWMEINHPGPSFGHLVDFHSVM